MKNIWVVIASLMLWSGCATDPCVDFDRAYRSQLSAVQPKAQGAQVVASIHRDIALQALNTSFKTESSELRLEPLSWLPWEACADCVSVGLNVLSRQVSEAEGAAFQDVGRARLVLALSTTFDGGRAQLTGRVTQVNVDQAGLDSDLRSAFLDHVIPIAMLRAVGPPGMLEPAVTFDIRAHQMDIVQSYPSLAQATLPTIPRVSHGTRIVADASLATHVLNAAVHNGHFEIPSGTRLLFARTTWRPEAIEIQYQSVVGSSCAAGPQFLSIGRTASGLVAPKTDALGERVTQLMLTLMPEHILASPRAEYTREDNVWVGETQGFTVDPVMAQIAKGLRRCLKGERPDSATIVLQWRVDPQGVVDEVEQIEGPQDPEVQQCILGAVSNAAFAPTGATRVLRREFKTAP